MRIIVLSNSAVPLGEQLAKEIEAWLTDQGIESCLVSTDSIDNFQESLEQFSLMVVLGGDGTTLKAARLTAPFDLPILGVNMGRVGFLSEATPTNWQEKLGQVIRNKHWLEKRLMLRAEVMRKGEHIGSLVALNDVVVGRGEQLRLVPLHLFVDGDPVTTYMADALIAATPTGSTAYSLAAGGPVLPPQLKNFLVLPVAPHLSFERALVLHEKAVIMVRLIADHEAMVTADGQDAITLQGGDEVTITRYAHDSSFIRLDSPGYFYRRLMEKLNYWSVKTIQ
ncbi:MAG: NAD(+)/NADH kinase [Candidatus Promineifilaceae bacterium]